MCVPALFDLTLFGSVCVPALFDTRDQWLPASQSTPPNIAEVNGRRSWRDRDGFLDFAEGSALEWTATQDVQIVLKGIELEMNIEPNGKLARIVSMLTGMAMKFESISEPEATYSTTINFDYAHRLWLSRKPR